MNLSDLANVNKTIGAKQTAKAVERGTVSIVFLAIDSDERVVSPIDELCQEHGVMVNREHTMEELGRAAKIKVKAAAVGVLK